MSTLFAELEAFCQRLDRNDALLVRRAIDELQFLRDEIDSCAEAEATLANPLAEISYHAEQLSTYIAQPLVSPDSLSAVRFHNAKILTLAEKSA